MTQGEDLVILTESLQRIDVLIASIQDESQQLTAAVDRVTAQVEHLEHMLSTNCQQ